MATKPSPTRSHERRNSVNPELVYELSQCASLDPLADDAESVVSTDSEDLQVFEEEEYNGKVEVRQQRVQKQEQGQEQEQAQQEPRRQTSRSGEQIETETQAATSLQALRKRQPRSRRSSASQWGDNGGQGQKTVNGTTVTSSLAPQEHTQTDFTLRLLVWLSILSVVAVIMLVMADLLMQPSAFRTTALLFSASACAASVIVSYSVGGRAAFSAHWQDVQPFRGGKQFVSLQAFGWTTFGVALAIPLLPLVISYFNIMATIKGALAIAGMFAVTAQVIVSSSILMFDPNRHQPEQHLRNAALDSTPQRHQPQPLSRLQSSALAQDDPLQFSLPPPDNISHKVPALQSAGTDGLSESVSGPPRRLESRIAEFAKQERHRGPILLLVFVASLTGTSGVGAAACIIGDLMFLPSDWQSSLLVLVAITCFSASIFITYGVGGRLRYGKQWAFYQPGRGGSMFVGLQTITWTFYSVSSFLFLLHLISNIWGDIAQIVAAYSETNTNDEATTETPSTLLQETPAMPFLPPRQAYNAAVDFVYCMVQERQYPMQHVVAFIGSLPFFSQPVVQTALSLSSAGTTAFIAQLCNAASLFLYKPDSGDAKTTTTSSVSTSKLAGASKKLPPFVSRLRAQIVVLYNDLVSFPKQAIDLGSAIAWDVLSVFAAVAVLNLEKVFVIILVLLLFLTKIFPTAMIVIWLAIIVGYLWTYRNEPSVSGSRELKQLRGSPLVEAIASYFNVQIIKNFEGNLDPAHRYIFGFHPHGIIPVTCGYIARIRAWQREFPNIFPAILSSSIVHFIPVMRDVLQYLGGREVSKYVFLKALKDVGSVMLIPGGQLEMTFSTSSTEAVTVDTSHKGFVKLALEEAMVLHEAAQLEMVGSKATESEETENTVTEDTTDAPTVTNSSSNSRTESPSPTKSASGKRTLASRTHIFLMPTFSFGETRVFDNAKIPMTLQKFCIRNLKANIMLLPYGQWNLPFIPRMTPLTLAVGKPVHVPYTPTITQRHVNALHARYMDELNTTVMEVRASTAHPDASLELYPDIETLTEQQFEEQWAAINASITDEELTKAEEAKRRGAKQRKNTVEMLLTAFLLLGVLWSCLYIFVSSYNAQTVTSV
eukprot:m.74908 g.74908  ORF g.74908 m.74908 type:complete len:1110 (-) comp12420_c0_seq3:358-3687(-)